MDFDSSVIAKDIILLQMSICDYKIENKCESLIRADLSVAMMLFSSVVLLVSLFNCYTSSEELLGTHIVTCSFRRAFVHSIVSE
jgi:hypothetical protein